MSVEIVKSQVWTRPEADQALEFHDKVLGPMNFVSATRHSMFSDDFFTLAFSKNVEKYTAYDDAGGILGLAMQTNVLSMWPSMSVNFFARHFPQHVEQDRFFYVIFVGVAPGGRLYHTFGHLLDAMTDGRRDDHKWAMDFCKANMDKRIVDLIKRRLTGTDPRARMNEVDRQVWFVVDYPDGHYPDSEENT